MSTREPQTVVVGAVPADADKQRREKAPRKVLSRCRALLERKQSLQPKQFPSWRRMFQLVEAYAKVHGTLVGVARVHKYVKQWLDQQRRAYRAGLDATHGYERRWHGVIDHTQITALRGIGFRFGAYRPSSCAQRLGTGPAQTTMELSLALAQDVTQALPAAAADQVADASGGSSVVTSAAASDGAMVVACGGPSGGPSAAASEVMRSRTKRKHLHGAVSDRKDTNERSGGVAKQSRRSSASDFAPRSGASDFAPRSGASDFAPRSGASDFAPRSGASEFASLAQLVAECTDRACFLERHTAQMHGLLEAQRRDLVRVSMLLGSFAAHAPAVREVAHAPAVHEVAYEVASS
jgi:hypothetical protein